MKAPALLLLLPWFFASCASDSGKGKSSASSASEHKKMNERFGGTGPDPNSFKRDANGGYTVNKDSKRSPYESMGEDQNFKKDGVAKKEYKTGDYAKKSWWGNKDYDRKTYAGNTDGSRFSKASSLQDKGAREAGANAKIKGDYQTDSYATNSASESNHQGIDKPSNDNIENRRDEFLQPEIIDWKEQRKLSLGQSRKLLGN